MYMYVHVCMYVCTYVHVCIIYMYMYVGTFKFALLMSCINIVTNMLHTHLQSTPLSTLFPCTYKKFPTTNHQYL